MTKSQVAFTKNTPENEFLFSEEERKFVNSLPQQISIFRGMTLEEYESGNFGISWTLDETIAKYFLTTFRRNYDTANSEKMVHSLAIDKNQIVAYFNDRKEKEIFFTAIAKNKYKHHSSAQAIKDLECPEGREASIQNS
jgi:hypothetical protein